VLDAGKVALVARIEPRGMGVRRNRDHKIHHARARLTARSRDRGRELPVAGGHRIVDRKRREPALKVRQSAESFSADYRVGGNEDAEMQFGEGRRR
jgi:hypothetical protein